MEAYQLQLIPNVTDLSFGIAGVPWDAKELHDQLKQMGGAWNKTRKLWVFSKQKRWDSVPKALGLTDKATRPQATEKLVEKPAPKAPKKADLLKQDAISARHLAMQFFIAGGGVNPECVSRYNGTFGRDRKSGKVFGVTERATMAWMLDAKQLPIDQLAIDLAQDTFFLPECIQDALLECVNEYADKEKNRATGRARMLADMQYEIECPF